MNVIPAVESRQARAFEARLDLLLVRVDQLPTLPQILWEIMAQLQNSRNAAIDLASAIEDDPSLTANVLRLANSAYYGFSGRFIGVRDAVVALGRSEIERMVNATLVIGSFRDADVSGSMDYSGFWIHCLQVAEASEFISTHHSTTSPYGSSEAYVSGLLHDIGKLVLDQFFPDDWAQIRTCAAKYACSDAEAERATIGMDHGEVGARLMEAWALAPNLIQGTRWHHRILQSNREHTIKAELIGFADRVSHSYARGQLLERAIPHSFFDLDERQVASLARALNNAARRATVLLS